MKIIIYFWQVQKLGCEAFALLFDDIDPQLHGPDVESFRSFGEAQVEITNSIYKYLGCPNFLFCPTGNVFSYFLSIKLNHAWISFTSPTISNSLDTIFFVLYTEVLETDLSKPIFNNVNLNKAFFH